VKVLHRAQLQPGEPQRTLAFTIPPRSTFYARI